VSRLQQFAAKHPWPPAADLFPSQEVCRLNRTAMREVVPGDASIVVVLAEPATVRRVADIVSTATVFAPYPAGQHPQSFAAEMRDYRRQVTPLRLEVSELVRYIAAEKFYPDFVYIGQPQADPTVIAQVLKVWSNTEIAGDGWEGEAVRFSVEAAAERRGYECRVFSGNIWKLEVSQWPRVRSRRV